MRKILIACFLLSTTLCFSQMPVNADGKIEYTEVVQADSISAQTLYSKAKLYVAKAFANGKEATQLNDDAAFTTVVNGATKISAGMGASRDGFVSFKLTIQCKDGRFRYSFTDLVHEGAQYSGGALENEKPACGTFFMNKQLWGKLKEQTDTNMKMAIASLKKEIKSSGNNDW